MANQDYVIISQGRGRWLVTFKGYRTRINVEGPRSAAVEAAEDFLAASQAELARLSSLNQALCTLWGSSF